MLAAFSDLLVWYQIPILAVIVFLFFLMKPLSIMKAKMLVSVRWVLNFLQLIIMFVLFFALVLPSLNRARDMELWAVCKTRLKGLGTAMEMYHQKYKVYPPSPKEFVDAGYASIENFQCPTDLQDREISYFYLPPLETDDGEAFVMCDLKGNHKNLRNVLRKKGIVEELSEEAFQAELAKPHNARFAEALKKAEGP